jgi:hypothetical protein
MSARRCTAIGADGRPCRATPLRDAPFCFWHAPETADQAADARRLGGLRRRRERALVGAYDLSGLDTAGGLLRILEIAVTETIGLDNSLPRARTLLSAVGMGVRLLEAADHEERLAALEAAIERKPARDSGPALLDPDGEPSR